MLISKKRKGGKGKKYETRNYAIVIARKANSKVFTFAELGKIFGINKTVVEDIYKRDEQKYQ